AEVRSRGIEATLEEAVGIASRGTGFYGISIDLDAVTPEDAPGGGTPGAGGFNGARLARALARFGGGPRPRAVRVGRNPPRPRPPRRGPAPRRVRAGRIPAAPRPRRLQRARRGGPDRRRAMRAAPGCGCPRRRARVRRRRGARARRARRTAPGRACPGPRRR